jgi:hypothetical protein
VVSSVYRPFILLCRSFLVLWSPICLYYLLVTELRGFYWGSPCLYLLLPKCITSKDYFLLFPVLTSVSGLILRSLIHFELILVQGDKHGSTFSFLEMANHFSQQLLLKRLPFLHRIFLASLSKIRWV